MASHGLSALALAFAFSFAANAEAPLDGAYLALERMDAKRVLMRVPPGAETPPGDAEIMLEELENWKWRVEMASAGAAILVTFSHCPHGLGLLPTALGWQGGGHWRQWPGTFEHTKGLLAEQALKDQEADPRSTLKVGDFSFIEAKAWCQNEVACAGFSFRGAWADKEREGGLKRTVYFAGTQKLVEQGKGSRWSSYVAKENPRANCNPEGEIFQCPRNAYACLGLSMDADNHAIKQAYRALSRRMHPDKLKASSRTAENVKKAEAAFRDVSEAHEVLSDAGKRREADTHLKRAKKQWEEQNADFQDLYIKETGIASLEPESYPILIPKGQEWLVHFFLPQNDGCKQMKMAFGRAVGELGVGEEERGLPAVRVPRAQRSLTPGAIFRGSLREKSSSLRNEGAQAAEGDTYVVLVVGADGNSATLMVGGDEIAATIQPDGEKLAITAGERTYTGGFDHNPEFFRGYIANSDKPKDEVASFALRRDFWQPPPVAPASLAPGARAKARLFGAVNCGRFREFCKRKGADPSFAKRFPQVRMLFPDEVRFEVYRGRPLGKELVAFAREASRARGEVELLNASSLAAFEAGPKQAPWLVMLHQDTTAKAALDCLLCRTALPMLRRTALRLEKAGVRVGWVNCSADEEICEPLKEDGVWADWGALRFLELGGLGLGLGPPPAPAGEEAPKPPPLRVESLWDGELLIGEMAQQGLVAALESAARTAEFLARLREEEAPATGATASEKGEL